MIELENDRLVFRFPEVHEDAVLRMDFQRTLRIPDDNRDYPLPPGLGSFPLGHVDDYADRAPQSWAQHGGIFFPMHQAEAMWISFHAGYPMAVKVAAGKVNALTGKRWRNELTKRPQDYLVVPDQPWLDGFCIRKGMVRQFVAMPLGEGYTAEEQLTGAAEHGGLQLVVYPMKAEAYEKLQQVDMDYRVYSQPPGVSACLSLQMGLAPGGLMRQEVYEDDYGFDAWDTSVRSRCFVHILNSTQYLTVCGVQPPHMPPTAAEYTDARLPWFEYYGGDLEVLGGSKALAGLDSVATKKWKQGAHGLEGNEPVQPELIKKLGQPRVRVREGEF